MKTIWTVIILLMTCEFFAQQNNDKSDLRIRVDSIITFQIGYRVDSTTNKVPVRKWDSTLQRGLYPSFGSLPPNPMTLILLDSQVVRLNELNSYDLSQVEIIKVYNKNDQTAIVLYGKAAKNGLIILKTK